MVIREIVKTALNEVRVTFDITLEGITHTLTGYISGNGGWVGLSRHDLLYLDKTIGDLILNQYKGNAKTQRITELETELKKLKGEI